MLILTRRIDEVIQINDDIKITLLGREGNQVHLGFEAPRDVPIYREEVYKRIHAEQIEEQKESEEKEEIERG